MIHSDPQTNLVWIDLEMTGLDLDICSIIEISVAITNSDLDIIALGPDLVIHQNEEDLAAMDDWNRDHHSQSGLLEKVKVSKLSLSEAESQIIDFIKEYVTQGMSPLCGNSIYNDRRFIIKYMPNLDKYLHYRVIDVSTIKELYKRWHPNLSVYEKQNNHRALDDIQESVNELLFYKKSFFK